VCQSLSVKDSTSETAKQMRDLVAQRVRDGRTNAEIEAEFLVQLTQRRRNLRLALVAAPAR